MLSLLNRSFKVIITGINSIPYSKFTLSTRPIAMGSCEDCVGGTYQTLRWCYSVCNKDSVMNNGENLPTVQENSNTDAYLSPNFTQYVEESGSVVVPL